MLWAEIRVSNACEKRVVFFLLFAFFLFPFFFFLGNKKFVAGHSKWFLKKFHVVVPGLN